LYKYRVQVMYTSTTCQGRGLLEELTPLLESSQAGAHLFPRALSIHAYLCKYHNLSASSQSTWDFYMTGGRVAFCFCMSRNVYQRDPATDRLSICDWSHATETAPSLLWVSVSVIESSPHKPSASPATGVSGYQVRLERRSGCKRAFEMLSKCNGRPFYH